MGVEDPVLQLTCCVVDLERRIVEAPDRTVRLTTREAELLAYLSERPSRVVPREELLQQVWGYHREVLSRAIDNAVSRLRSKIEADPLQPVHLLTEFGVGYRFVARSEEVEAPRAPEQPLLVLAVGPVDLTRGLVHRPEGTVVLASGELALLRELVKSAGPAIEPHQLERRVWGNVSWGSSRLRSVIWRLRAKIEVDPSAPRHLLAPKGQGYRFVLPESAPPSGVATVLVARVAEHLEDSPPDQLLLSRDRLWAAATELASRHGGYPADLSGGRICLVFSRPDAAVRAGHQLSQRVPGIRVGLATGEVRRTVNPLSQRFEYLGPPLVLAERRCRLRGRSQSVLADQASERVAAA